MAFTIEYPVYGGEHNDKDAENASVFMGVVDVSSSTTRVQTGARGNEHNLVGVSKKAVLQGGRALASTPAILVCSAAGGLSAAPAQAMGLLVGHTNEGSAIGTSGLKKLVQIGTDRLLRFYSAQAVSTQVGWPSVTAIPTTGLQELMVVYDGLSHTTMWIHCAIGTAWELSFDTGLSWSAFWGGGTINVFWGDYTDGSTDHNVTLFTDDLIIANSTTAGDAPHLIAYPRLRINGARNPTTNGFHSGGAGNWTNQAAAAATFAEVDNSELPTHDSDTTYWTTTGNSTTQGVLSTDANPVASGATVRHVMQRIVAQTTDASKGGLRCIMRLGGVDVVTNFFWVPSTSYGGNYALNLARPGGGAWAVGDFAASTLEWGSASAASGLLALRVTLELGPDIAYSTASHALAPTPGIRRRGVVVG